MRENYRNSIASVKKFPQFTTMNVIYGQAGIIIYASLIFYSLTIDNILNIIVLLILAGVSISMLSGDNSILNRATTARETTGQKQIEERVSLAYNAAVMEDINNGDGKLQKNTLSAELAKLFPGSTINIDTETDTTGKKWYVTIDGGTPIEVEAGKSTPQVAELPKDAGTTPYLPSTAFHQLPGTTLEKGLVITDATDPADTTNPGNEYVWIEVPNANLGGEVPAFGPDYATQGLTTAKITEETITDDQKTKIETALINYVTDLLSGSDYKTSRMGWKDEWYDTNGKNASNGGTTTDAGGCGLTETQYTTLYKKMLKSVYNNGGFWIGRYEAGTTTARQSGSSASGITPLSKIDLYPINWVKCSEAQTIASSTQNIDTTKYTSSLMFGIQWDLVLKFIKVKENISENTILTSNSEGWGNYNYAYDLNQTSAHGYKGVLSLSDNSTLTWSPIESSYSHSVADWSTTAPIALSTGATTRNMKQNIYDIAGNMFEWTLEHATSSTNYPCADRGGFFLDTGSSSPASSRCDSGTSFSGYGTGFRVSLY